MCQADREPEVDAVRAKEMFAPHAEKDISVLNGGLVNCCPKVACGS